VSRAASGGTLRALKTAASLGWRIESNWTDPLLFAIYAVARPLAQAAILVVMYGIIRHGRFGDPLFAFMYAGNAFYLYAGSIIAGVSWAVIDDRERYRTLKYIYVAPVPVPAYLIGRGAARFATGTISVILTMAAGVLFLRLPIHTAAIDVPLFVAATGLGIASLVALGLIVAGISLLVAHQVMVIGEAIAAALFLVSGAAFPVTVLPAWLQPVALALPMTWWLEATRRALMPDLAVGASPAISALGTGRVLAILAGLTVLTVIAAAVALRACDHRAREAGLIDRTTNY